MEKKPNILKKPNFAKTSFTVDREVFETFKQLCKLNNTDCSKLIRTFIAEYTKKELKKQKKSTTFS